MYFFSFTLAGVLLVVMQICVTVHIILHKEDVPSAIGWTGLVWLAPMLGCVVYVILGINRVRRKAARLHNRGADIFTLTGKTAQEIEREIPPSFVQLLRLGYKVHPQHLALGNSVSPLLNGDAAYPKMCAAIAEAQKEVLIESYIFNNDKAGQQFISAIKQACQNGAQVRVLVDGVGVNYSHPNIIKALRDLPQVELGIFLRSKSPINLPFVNLRNHRKIMIIDGEVAFFGGMNLAEGNLLSTKPKEPIQDVTFEVRGPVIEQMAKLFEEDWRFATHKTFSSVSAQAKHALAGSVPARIIPDGPDGDYGKLERLFLGALACAQKTAFIVTPYFLPENEILSALETAVMRGVRVEIILPQKSNIFGMDRAMRANFRRLLGKGVKIYQAAPPFDHSKLFMIDDAWVLAGSANWDVRSFKLNFESAIECFHPQLAQEVRRIIEHKKKLSAPVPYEPHPPLLRRLLDNTLRLLTPYY